MTRGKQKKTKIKKVTFPLNFEGTSKILQNPIRILKKKAEFKR